MGKETKKLLIVVTCIRKRLVSNKFTAHYQVQLTGEH